MGPGAMTVRHPSTSNNDMGAGSSSFWNTLWGGVGVSGLNPKGLLISRPAAARAVSQFSGTAMVVIGALLITERLAH